jgi:GNAT superfamily N-acetyltransferase
MAAVELRDIVTDADRAAALAVRRGPGQERFVASVEKSFADAIAEPYGCPRMWAAYDGDRAVGFVMISDGIPPETLAADPELLGPYYLWRLLIDEPAQRQGYGTACLDAIVSYVRTRPGAETLWTSCGQDPGTPQPFYERYGFIATERFIEGERVMRLDLRERSR